MGKEIRESKRYGFHIEVRNLDLCVKDPNIYKILYLTGVVAPEPDPARDGDASSALGGVACDTNQASTTCRVAFLQK